MFYNEKHRQRFNVWLCKVVGCKSTELKTKNYGKRKEEKINKDYQLSDFQKKELSNLYKKGTKIIDFYVDDEDNDLVLCVKDNDDIIDYFIIYEETDVYFSRIGRHDSNLDKLEKIN